MKTITSAVLGLSFALAGFAQAPAAQTPAAKGDTMSSAHVKTKKVKKHKKGASVTAEKPSANAAPATK